MTYSLLKDPIGGDLETALRADVHQMVTLMWALQQIEDPTPKPSTASGLETITQTNKDCETKYV